METPHDIQKGLENALGVPFTSGNRIDPLRNGAEIFPALLESIRSAEYSVEFLTYVYWTGEIAEEFADALAEKAREGILVRVLLDAFGAHDMSQELCDRMRGSGVDVRWFRPFSYRLWNSDNRTHRKVLICDGKVAYTGGVGIAEEWQGDARSPDEWRDDHFRVQGPAANLLAGAFWGNWAEADVHHHTPKAVVDQSATQGNVDAQVVCSSASGASSAACILMRFLLAHARSRLRVCTPYLVLDDIFRGLLKDKAREGVDIEIIIPGKHIDQRFDQLAGEADFKMLLEAGVRIFRYQKTMIHVKSLLVDDVLCSVGSCNFNQRSLYKDDEVIVNVANDRFIQGMNASFEKDLEDCEEVTNTQWRHRSVFARAGEAIMQPFRHQL